MRRSKVLTKLRQGRFVRICSMGHVIPFFIRHAANLNYDGIWLDLEHRCISSQDVRYLLALCHYNDIDCMVRPPTMQRTRLYRYLEDGATGFMLPFISSAEKATQAVKSVKFPPEGDRGIDGTGLDADYGFDLWKQDNTFTFDANQQTFVVAQIETPEAIANVSQIAAIAGIDCLFVGPGDLGLRLAASGAPGKAPLAEAVQRVSSAARRYNKAWGIAAGSKEDFDHYCAMGAQMVPWGSDFWLSKALHKGSQEIDDMLEKRRLESPVDAKN